MSKSQYLDMIRSQILMADPKMVLQTIEWNRWGSRGYSPTRDSQTNFKSPHTNLLHNTEDTVLSP